MPNSGVTASIAGSVYDLENEIKERVTSEYSEAKAIMKDARKHVKVGNDHAKLHNGLTGKVKWIGISDVTNNELIVLD